MEVDKLESAVALCQHIAALTADQAVERLDFTVLLADVLIGHDVIWLQLQHKPLLEVVFPVHKLVDMPERIFVNEVVDLT